MYFFKCDVVESQRPGNVAYNTWFERCYYSVFFYTRRGKKLSKWKKWTHNKTNPLSNDMPKPKFNFKVYGFDPLLLQTKIKQKYVFHLPRWHIYIYETNQSCPNVQWKSFFKTSSKNLKKVTNAYWAVWVNLFGTNFRLNFITFFICLCFLFFFAFTILLLLTGYEW